MKRSENIGKRILVIGCPGSGKSTFARQLHEQSGIPLFHLDNLWWKPDRTHITREEFDQKLDILLEQDAWILDGDYSRTMERRMSACDSVVFLDYPEEICLEGIRARIGQPRPDLPWTEPGIDPELVEDVRNYRENKRPAVYALKEAYPDRFWLILESRAAADEWLKTDRAVRTVAQRFKWD